jgi:hypothetical protein
MPSRRQKEKKYRSWSDKLEESAVAGVSSIREKIGEPFVTFKTPTPPGMIRETEDCRIAPTGQVVEEFITEGELKPEIGVAKVGNLNGAGPGAPSQFKFSGASTGALAGGGQWNGNLKYLGYFHQEVISVQGIVVKPKLIPEGFIVQAGDWIFPFGEGNARNLTIENPSPGTVELLTQQIEVITGGNFIARFIEPPEGVNCPPFNDPPVVSLPPGGKCNVRIEALATGSGSSRYLLTYKEPSEPANIIEQKLRK